jgi:hypothetical protein
LHQLQVLEQQRNASSNSSATGKRKRASSASSFSTSASGLVNQLGTTSTSSSSSTTKANNGKDKNKPAAAGADDVRAKRFKAALEQLAAQDAPSRGRGRQRVNGMLKTDALVASIRKAHERQQADRTKPNLTRLRITDRAASKGAKSDVKSVITLSGRGKKKRRERKWHIKKDDDKPREVAKW